MPSKRSPEPSPSRLSRAQAGAKLVSIDIRHTDITNQEIWPEVNNLIECHGRILCGLDLRSVLFEEPFHKIACIRLVIHKQDFQTGEFCEIYLDRQCASAQSDGRLVHPPCA